MADRQDNPSDYGREVTEMDLRLPEFRTTRPDELEFRRDGRLVRKDRWESAVHRIRSIVGQTGGEFEIDEVVDGVRCLAEGQTGWSRMAETEESDLPADGQEVELQLLDGSVLNHVTVKYKCAAWEHALGPVPLVTVRAWREPRS